MRVRKSLGKIVAGGRASRFLGIVGPDRTRAERSGMSQLQLSGRHEPASATMRILRSTQSPTQNRPTDHRYFDLDCPNMENGLQVANYPQQDASFGLEVIGSPSQMLNATYAPPGSSPVCIPSHASRSRVHKVYM